MFTSAFQFTNPEMNGPTLPLLPAEAYHGTGSTAAWVSAAVGNSHKGDGQQSRTLCSIDPTWHRCLFTGSGCVQTTHP